MTGPPAVLLVVCFAAIFAAQWIGVTPSRVSAANPPQVEKTAKGPLRCIIEGVRREEAGGEGGIRGGFVVALGLNTTGEMIKARTLISTKAVSGLKSFIAVLDNGDIIFGAGRPTYIMFFLTNESGRVTRAAKRKETGEHVAMPPKEGEKELYEEVAYWRSRYCQNL